MKYQSLAVIYTRLEKYDLKFINEVRLAAGTLQSKNPAAAECVCTKREEQAGKLNLRSLLFQRLLWRLWTWSSTAMAALKPSTQARASKEWTLSMGTEANSAVLRGNLNVSKFHYVVHHVAITPGQLVDTWSMTIIATWLVAWLLSVAFRKVSQIPPANKQSRIWVLHSDGSAAAPYVYGHVHPKRYQADIGSRTSQLEHVGTRNVGY